MASRRMLKKGSRRSGVSAVAMLVFHEIMAQALCGEIKVNGRAAKLGAFHDLFYPNRHLRKALGAYMAQACAEAAAQSSRDVADAILKAQGDQCGHLTPADVARGAPVTGAA